MEVILKVCDEGGGGEGEVFQATVRTVLDRARYDPQQDRSFWK
jgi:hypothetical protein